MELYNEILTKEQINNRFIEAVYLVLNNKFVSDKTTLAEALRCKPAKFSEILNGRMKAGIDMAAYICEYFDISPDWLLLSRGGYFRTSQTPSIFVSQGPNTPEYFQYVQAYKDFQKKQTKHTDNIANDAQFNTFMALIKDKDLIIREQATEIGRLQEQIRQLTIEKEKHVSDVATSLTADAG